MNSHDDMDGYTVAYERDELQFPVYVVIATALALLAWAFSRSNPFVFTLGSAALCFAYHNFPLLETGRPRLGAGQYGLFLEGLGVIAWRSIDSVDIVPTSSRGAVDMNLVISLNKPLEQALIADWRVRPFYRTLMRLPWTSESNRIIIKLAILDRPADEIHHNFSRLWRFFRA